MKTIAIFIAVTFTNLSNSFAEDFSKKLILNIPHKSIANVDTAIDKGFTAPAPMKNQSEEVWCWAATAAMVIEYFNGLPIQDYEVLSKYFTTQNQIYGGGMIDCRDRRNKICYRPGQDFEIVAIYSMFQISAPQIFRAPSFQELVNYLERTHTPIVARMNNPKSSIGHVVTIIGYNGPNVIVNDPILNGTIEVDYEEFKMNYYKNGFQWIGSFLPQRILGY